MASTAAVLNILVKANTAQAQAALGKTQGALAATDKAGGRTAARLKTGMKVAGAGMAAGFGIAAVAVKKFTDAAAESEASNARMRAQLKASGVSFDRHRDKINKVIESQSKLSALDDEDLQDSFTNIVRVTGDVNKALELNAIAADFARAKNMDVAKAGELVGKVAGGNTGILGRYGIQIEKGASASEALALLQKKFAGQAKAYGETQAGASDRFKVAIGNLQEALGARLLPIMTKVMNAASGFVNDLISGTGAAGGFGRVVVDWFGKAQSAVGTAIGFIKGQLEAHREDIRQAGEAARNVGKAIVFVWEQAVLPVVKRVLPAIVQIVRGAFDMIGGAVRLITALLRGDFRKAWEAVKQIFKGALNLVVGQLRAFTAPLRETAARVGSAISGAFSDAWDKVRETVRTVKGWLSDRWEDIRKNFAKGKDGLVSAITAPFRAAVTAVGKFAKLILQVVDKVPGVDMKGPIAAVDKFVEAHGLAQGGAFARTRGKVNKPITLMGEEAPRYPEYVIPTNPAYRSRAQKLAAEASQRVGLYAGGGRHGDGIGGVNLNFLNPANLINSLPGTKQLGMMAGLGNWTIGKVSAWIRSQFGKLMGRHAPGWGVIDRLAAELGLGITSTYRPGDDGFHGIPLGTSGRARATDYSGSSSAMLQFAKLAATRWGSNLRELIHSPLGWGIDEGKRVSAMFFGQDVYDDHFDHVHAAFAKGGIHAAAQAAHAAGFRGLDLIRAVAIAGAESNYRSGARNGPNRIEDSRGLWQINAYAHPWINRMNWRNPTANARAAHRVWRAAGGSFKPWSTWPGKAGAYMARARRAVAALKKKGGKPGGIGVEFGPGHAEFDPWVPPGWESGGDTTPPSVGGDGGGPSSPASTADTGAAELAAQLRRMNDFNDWLVNTQGPTLVGAVVAAVNGGIGGPVGLGFQGIRSTPGSTAGL